MALGRIHSTESFGTMDGPGVRYVVFMQGCPLRCLYCHNPDTWSQNGGRLIPAEDIIAEYKRNSAFYKNGGLTVSGGEPLLQMEFLTELFAMARSEGIHTAIDTSGATYSDDAEYIKKLDALMENTDLVLLDIKHMDSAAHKDLTGIGNEPVLGFAKYLDKKGIPVWIRRVVVSGYTDGKEELERLGGFMATLGNVKALDVLPYHTMGEAKYKELGIKYRLEGVPALAREDAIKAKKEILYAMKKAKGDHRNG